MARMNEKDFAKALNEWAELVIKAQADRDCVDARGWMYSYDTLSMVKAVDALIAEGFGRDKVLNA